MQDYSNDAPWKRLNFTWLPVAQFDMKNSAVS